MSTVKEFEDLEIWKMARDLVNNIYEDFRNCKDYVFRDQIISAGLSIKNNIAEGFCRNSDKEFKQFLNISKGSCGEVKSLYYIAEDQKYITAETAGNRRTRCSVLNTKITNFMFYLKQ